MGRSSRSASLVVKLFWTLNGLYLLLAGLYLSNASKALLLGIACLTAVLTVLLCMCDPLHGLYLTILATHLGPVVRTELIAVGMVTLGDIHLLILMTGFTFRAMKQGRFSLGPFSAAMALLAFFSILTVAFASDFRSVTAGAISQIQVAIVYFLTINLVRQEKDAALLLRMIGFAVVVSATMHIVAYAQGRTLLLSMQEIGNDVVSQYEEIQWTLNLIYNKTSFFYGSFIASCTVGMTLAATHLTLSTERPRLLAFWAIVGLAALLSSLVGGNRTPLVATGVSCAIILGVLLRKFPRKKWIFRRIIMICIVGPIMLATAFFLQWSITKEAQFESFRIMFMETAWDSMSERFLMWRAAMDYVIRFPKEFLIGVGPDVLTRGAKLSVVQLMMNIPGLSIQLPSFHNFYIDVIFQNGIFFFSIAAYIIAATLTELVRRFSRLDDSIARDCLFALLAWLVMWNSHATGWSKPVLILSEILGLAHIVIINRMHPYRFIRNR